MVPRFTVVLFNTKTFQLFSLPWFWYFVFGDCRPNRVRGFLFFESPFEHFLNVVHAEGTDCRAGNAEKWENREEEAGNGGHARVQQGAPLGGAGFCLFPPVELRGEDPNHGGDAIDLYYVCDGLQDVEIEKGISGDRAVKPSLQEGSPVFLQDPLWATHVVLTNASHAGVHSLPGDKSQAMDEVMSMQEELGKMLLFRGGTKTKTNKPTRCLTQN